MYVSISDVFTRQEVICLGFFTFLTLACGDAKLSEKGADKHLGIEQDNCPELFHSILLPFYH